jgi:hypothetical protein
MEGGPAVIFQCEFQNGRTIWYEPAKVIQFVAKLEGCRGVVTIEKWHPRRSDRQNRYFHGAICREISKHLGWELEDVKSYLKQKLLLTEKDGRVFARSTATLTTAEFATFLDDCIRLAAVEMDFVVSDPWGTPSSSPPGSLASRPRLYQTSSE